MSDPTLPLSHGKDVDLSFEEALHRTEQALEREGFGVLTRIDVKATLKKKLDVEFTPCQILGACMPAMAHKALTTEPGVAIMMPCNVVVRATGDGRTRVETINTDAMVAMFPGVDLSEMAEVVGGSLQRVLDSI